MTKNELLKKYNEICEIKKIKINGINQNCNKSVIENAINCLMCSDEQLEEYLIVFKLKYPNSYRAVIRSDWKIHCYNRLYVFNTARSILS